MPHRIDTHRIGSAQWVHDIRWNRTTDQLSGNCTMEYIVISPPRFDQFTLWPLVQGHYMYYTSSCWSCNCFKINKTNIWSIVGVSNMSCRDVKITPVSNTSICNDIRCKISRQSTKATLINNNITLKKKNSKNKNEACLDKLWIFSVAAFYKPCDVYKCQIVTLLKQHPFIMTRFRW